MLGLLGEDSDDLLAVDAGAYGACHFRCLAASPWGAFWAQRYTAHLVQNQFAIIGPFDAWTALRQVRLKEIAFVQRSTGWFLRYPEREVRRAITAAEAADAPYSGVLFEVGGAGTIHLDLQQTPRIAQTIKQSFSRGDAFPLLNLVRLLGIADRMLYPDALSGGALLPIARRGKDAAAQQAASPASWVVAHRMRSGRPLYWPFRKRNTLPPPGCCRREQTSTSGIMRDGHRFCTP